MLRSLIIATTLFMTAAPAFGVLQCDLERVNPRGFSIDFPGYQDETQLTFSYLAGRVTGLLNQRQSRVVAFAELWKSPADGEEGWLYNLDGISYWVAFSEAYDTLAIFDDRSNALHYSCEEISDRNR